MRLAAWQPEPPGTNRHASAEALLRQATVEDSGFASAWLLLSHVSYIQSRPVADYLPLAERALELSSGVSAVERYSFQGVAHRKRTFATPRRGWRAGRFGACVRSVAHAGSAALLGSPRARPGLSEPRPHRGCRARGAVMAAAAYPDSVRFAVEAAKAHLRPDTAAAAVREIAARVLASPAADIETGTSSLANNISWIPAVEVHRRLAEPRRERRPSSPPGAPTRPGHTPSGFSATCISPAALRRARAVCGLVARGGLDAGELSQLHARPDCGAARRHGRVPSPRFQKGRTRGDSRSCTTVPACSCGPGGSTPPSGSRRSAAAATRTFAGKSWPPTWELCAWHRRDTKKDLRLLNPLTRYGQWAFPAASPRAFESSAMALRAQAIRPPRSACWRTSARHRGWRSLPARRLYDWIRCRVLLSELYIESGRTAEARKVAEEVRTLLGVANAAIRCSHGSRRGRFQSATFRLEGGSHEVQGRAAPWLPPSGGSLRRPALRKTRTSEQQLDRELHQARRPRGQNSSEIRRIQVRDRQAEIHVIGQR